MKYVFVLEDEPKFQKEIVEALFRLNPNLQIRLFSGLEPFANWIKDLMSQGRVAFQAAGKIPDFVEFPTIPDDGKAEVPLVVSRIEFMGAGELGLLKRVKQLFNEKGLNPEGSQTAFVLTAFENKNFDPKQLEAAVVTNMIYKPFDRLILKEHLAYAMETHTAPSKDHEIAQQKTDTFVEMLKDVPIEGLSDIGFISKTDKNIEAGTFGKYYGQQWTTATNSSTFAICTGLAPHPIEVGFNQATFNFFGLTQEQISAVRKKARAPGQNQLAWKWRHKDAEKESSYNFVVIDEEEHLPGGLIDHFQKNFLSVNVVHYNHFGTFMLDFDPAKGVKERDTSIRALPASIAEIELHFDGASKLFLGFGGDKKESIRMFGLNESDLKKAGSWLYNGIDEKQKQLYSRLSTGTMNIENWDHVFTLNFKMEQYYLKALGVTKDGSIVKLKMKELTKDDLVSFLRKHSKVPQKVHAIFVSDKYLGNPGSVRWTPIIDQLKTSGKNKPKVIILSKKVFSDTDARDLATFAQDVLYKPVDRSYLNQKITAMLPFLKKKDEEVETAAVNLQEIIKAANPVRMFEVSEAGVMVDFDRDPGLDTYREFVLWQPYKIGDPELRAKVNFVQPPKEKGAPHQIQFIFFGVTDQFLKKIRVWIRNLYINTKKEAG